MSPVHQDVLGFTEWRWLGLGLGLGLAFLVTFAVLVLMILRSEQESGIDQGFMGLIILLVTIFYLVAFSILVAASVDGVGIKILVVLVDGLVLIGGKLLTPTFLRYLASEPIGPSKDE